MGWLSLPLGSSYLTLPYTWDLRWQEKFARDQVRGARRTWVRLPGRSSNAVVDFHEIFRAYVDSDLGPMPKSCAPQVCRNTPRGLNYLNDAVRSVMRRLPLSVHRAAAEAVLNSASIETGVILNMSSARLSTAIGEGRNSLKQNIFDQAFR